MLNNTDITPFLHLDQTNITPFLRDYITHDASLPPFTSCLFTWFPVAGSGDELGLTAGGRDFLQRDIPEVYFCVTCLLWFHSRENSILIRTVTT